MYKGAALAVSLSNFGKKLVINKYLLISLEEKS